MKLHLFTSLSLTLFVSQAVQAELKDNTFVAKKDSHFISEVGKCDERHAPYSTFKVALALMGFDSGILTNRDLPRWSFEKAYEKNFSRWYTPEKGAKYKWFGEHTPASFMKHSVLWYSHQITKRLGKQKFKQYVSKLNYGNMDVSGTLGKGDGLLNSWLGTSLKISPREQIQFLEKLRMHDLPLSKDAAEKTRELLALDETWDGWKVFGKTGGGGGHEQWFVGWVEKNTQRIFFAQFVTLDNKELQAAIGNIAKQKARENLLKTGVAHSCPPEIRAPHSAPCT